MARGKIKRSTRLRFQCLWEKRSGGLQKKQIAQAMAATSQ